MNQKIKHSTKSYCIHIHFTKEGKHLNSTNAWLSKVLSSPPFRSELLSCQILNAFCFSGNSLKEWENVSVYLSLSIQQNCKTTNIFKLKSSPVIANVHSNVTWPLHTTLVCDPVTLQHNFILQCIIYTTSQSLDTLDWRCFSWSQNLLT